MKVQVVFGVPLCQVVNNSFEAARVTAYQLMCRYVPEGIVFINTHVWNTYLRPPFISVFLVRIRLRQKQINKEMARQAD